MNISTLLEFRQNEALQSAFAAAYYSPEVQYAIRTLKELKEPRTLAAPENIDHTVWNAHLNVHREGFYEALHLLELLAKPIQKVGETPDHRIMPNLVNEDTYTE